MAKGKEVLTTGEVAKICNVAPRTVSKWFDSGELKGYRIPGSKDRRIPVRQLIRFMKTHDMPVSNLSGGGTRILIVDTDSEAADELAGKLRNKSDYKIRIASTALEAGMAAKEFLPHAVLISLLSDGINAGEICNAFREDEDLQTTKIIAVANKLSDAETSALLQKGFEGYIDRSEEAGRIIGRIEEAIAIVY